MSDPTPDPLAENIETIAQLREHARDRAETRLHGPVERLFALLAQPTALYVLVGLMLVWIVTNLVLGRHPLDPAPFYYMQGLIGVLALLTTVSVLIVQDREGRLARRRAELELQINLLAEQKVAKLIQLVEELRHDLPNVRDREDPQAQAMQRGADPASVLEALEERESGPNARQPHKPEEPIR